MPPTEPGPTFHFAEDGQLEEIYDYIPTEDSVERECNENPPRAPAPPPTPPSAKTVYTDPKEATRSTVTFTEPNKVLFALCILVRSFAHADASSWSVDGAEVARPRAPSSFSVRRDGYHFELGPDLPGVRQLNGS